MSPLADHGVSPSCERGPSPGGGSSMKQNVPWVSWAIGGLCGTGYLLGNIVHWRTLEVAHTAWRTMGSASAFRSPIYWSFAPVATLLHTGLIHLAVNLWCLATLGVFVERRQGWVAVLLMSLIGAYAAMGVEALIGGVGRIGLSAVTYTWLGVALGHWRETAASPRRFYTAVAMLVFLVAGILEAVGFPAVFPEIAHVAHATGLLTGLIIGPVFGWRGNASKPAVSSATRRG